MMCSSHPENLKFVRGIVGGIRSRVALRRRLHSGPRLLATFGLLTAGLATSPAAVAADLLPLSAASGPSASGMSTPQRHLRADFSGQAVSSDARHVADWVVVSGDNQGLPFMIVDKANARMFLFDAGGAILGGVPVLLGLARGDDSPPGIGDRPLSMIRPSERITPAGRFVAQLGLNLAGQDILWVDYDAAISVHRATDSKHGLTSNGRLARLASASPLDNRISHGCINVSAAFFENILRPAFSGTSGIVYVLPETRSVRDEFPVRV